MNQIPRINQFDDRTCKEIIKLVRRYRESIFGDVRPEAQRPSFRPDHIAATVVSVVPPATFQTGTFKPGLGEAGFYYLQPQNGELGPIVPGLQRIWNYSLTQTYPKGTTVVVHRDQHGEWIIDNDSPPSIRFILTSNMTNRQALATVTWMRGHAPNTSSMDLLKLGDTVTVADPHNLWPEAIIGGTGAAYLQPSVEGGHGYRWEVEECSLPINEIEGTVTNCLKKSDETGTAMLGPLSQLKIRSSYPNVDLPPEFAQECAGTAYYAWSSDWDDPNGFWSLINGCDDESCESTPPTTPPASSGDLTRLRPCEATDATPLQVDFKNPWGLFACGDTKVVLRRVTNTTVSDPGNQSVPLPPSVDEIEWEVVSVEEPIARFATFTKSGEDWDLADYWDGCDPSICGDPTVVCEFDCSCLDDGDKIVASYDPEADQYRGISSASAMLGPPDTKTIPVGDINFSGCGITYSKQAVKVFTCDSEPTLHVSYPDLITVPVVTKVYEGESGIVIENASVYVCQSTVLPANLIPYEPCEEDVPCDEAECVYTWNKAWDDETGEWELTTACPGDFCNCTGPPLLPPQNENDTVKSFACSGVTPPEGCEGSTCRWVWTTGDPLIEADWDDPAADWLATGSCPNGCECGDPPEAPTNQEEASSVPAFCVPTT